MDDFNDQQFEFCKLFLKFIGLWPQLTNFRRRLGVLIYSLIYFSFLFPLIVRLIEDGSDYQIRCVNIGAIAIYSVSTMKYYMLYFNVHGIKLLVVQIQKSKRKINDLLEFKILNQYEQQGRKLSILYTGYIFCSWTVFSFMPLIPHVLDIVLPLKNGTRSSWIHFYVDYVFFELPNQNYYMNIYVAILYGVFAVVICSTDILFIMAIKYTCGLFAITSKRILNTTKIVNNVTVSTSVPTVTKECLAEAVDLHNECIRCCDTIENVFSTFHLIIQTLAIIGFSCGLILVFQFYNYDAFYVTRGIILYFGTMIYLLLSNGFGQLILDSSEKVFDSANWYYAPVSIRKSLIILMSQSLRPYHITAGKFLILSFKSFGLVLKTSVSFFTVFYSLM